MPPPDNPPPAGDRPEDDLDSFYRAWHALDLSAREGLARIAPDPEMHRRLDELLDTYQNGLRRSFHRLLRRPGASIRDPHRTSDALAEGSERLLAPVELGDIVQLQEPYFPNRGRDDRQQGPFTHGIVAEIVSRLPDGRPRTVSLYLYDPERCEIYLAPNGVPVFVDHAYTHVVLYKRATESGYEPLVRPAAAASSDDTE